jgi:hypothetical protein
MLSNSAPAFLTSSPAEFGAGAKPQPMQLVEDILNGFDQFCALFDQLMAAA